MQRFEEAFHCWSSGQALEAGRIIYEQVPDGYRSLWAVGILEQCLPLVPPVAEFEQVRSLAHEPARWKEAHAAFRAVRKLTLQEEKAKIGDSVYSLLLYMVENTAKVIYNASGEANPFDHDAGWWVVECARAIVNKAAEPGLEERVWSAIAATGTV